MAVTLDEQLLEVLACPAPDHAPLRVGANDDPEADALTCTSCGRVFPVRDGIPVLLLDEAVETQGQHDTSHGAENSDDDDPDGV